MNKINFYHLFYLTLVFYLIIPSYSLGQDLQPDIGDTILLCRTNYGETVIELTNKNVLENNYSNPTEYKWLELIGGWYQIHKQEKISSFDEIESLVIANQEIHDNRTFRLIIIGNIPEDSSEISGNEFFIYNDVDIIVNNPKLEISDSIFCEGIGTKVRISWCDQYDINNCNYVIKETNINPNFRLQISPQISDSGSFIIVIPSLDSCNSYEDQFFSIQGYIVLNEIDTFFTNVQSIRIINVRPPSIPFFHYICGSNNEVSLDLGGRNDSNFSYCWFYRSIDTIPDSTININSSKINLNLEGKYYALIIKLDAIYEHQCFAVSPEINSIAQSVSPDIMPERQFLYGLEDSVKIELTFTFPEGISDLIRIDWFKDGDLINDEHRLFYYVKQPGLYNAVIYELCEDTTNSNLVYIQHDIKPNSVNKLNDNNDILSIYPNPNSGILMVEIKNLKWLGQNINYNIHNSIGKIVKSGEFIGSNHFEINIQDLANGQYFIKFKDKVSEKFKIYPLIKIN